MRRPGRHKQKHGKGPTAEPGIRASFVVPVKDDDRVFDCIDSFLAMDDMQSAELIIVGHNPSKSFAERIAAVVSSSANLVCLITDGTTRQECRDRGARAARSDWIGYVDSDCTFASDYLRHLLPLLGDYPVLRGRVAYQPRDSLFSRWNCTLRTIADEQLFRDETFSPNLILARTVLEQVGGWYDRGRTIHHSDDFVLSDRVRRAGYSVVYRTEIVLFHHDDIDAGKTIRTWYGYGLGWGFRYWKNRREEGHRTSLWSYVPPFPYQLGRGLGYLGFVVFHWFVGCTGFLTALRRFRGQRLDMPQDGSEPGHRVSLGPPG